MRKLFFIQDQTVQEIILKNYLAIFNECGTGKTYTMLYAMKCIQKKFLVVCPIPVMDWWIEEAKELDLKLLKIYGNKKKKMEIINSVFNEYDGFVINYDGLKTFINKDTNGKINCELIVNFIRKNDIKILICDESTYFKHRNQRFRILRNIMWYFERRYILTGTPITNSLQDIWPQIYILDGGSRLGKTWTNFLNKYFYCANRYIYKYEPYSWAEEEIPQKIKDIEVRYKLSDIKETEIPEEIIYSYRYNTPPDIVVNSYDTVLKELYLKIQNSEITVANSGAMFQKLLEITSGFIYDNEGKMVSIDNYKVKDVIDLIENELYGKNILIYYNFTAEGLLLEKALINYKFIHIHSGYNEKQRMEYIRQYQKGLYNILISHPRLIGFGVNLQNTDYIIWISPPTSLEVFQQANSRVFRTGYKGNKVVCYIISSDSLIDKQVYKLLQKKERIQTKFLDIIKTEYNKDKVSNG